MRRTYWIAVCPAFMLGVGQSMIVDAHHPFIALGVGVIGLTILAVVCDGRDELRGWR